MDVLEELRRRHAPPAASAPPCPSCGERPTSARIVIVVRRKTGGRRTDETVISAVRTMCAHCVADAFELFVSTLPEPSSSAGPGRPRAVAA